MQRVGPLMGDATMEFAETLCRLAAVVAALLLARHRALAAFDRPETLFQVARIGFLRAVRERGKLLDAQIHAYYWPSIRRYSVLLLHQHRDVPMPRLFAHRGREDAGIGWQVAALFQAQPPHARQLYHAREHHD